MLSVVILTRNEEMHIGRAIESVAPIANQIVVVDSYSTDRTVEIARQLGATVLQHPFENYARQFQWALDNGGLTEPWVMRLDADEIIDPPLREELKNKLPQLGSDVVGVNLKRRHMFMDKWIRFGGRYPLILLRIWRRGCGRIENRWMDEHMVVSGGDVVTFDNYFTDKNEKDITFFTEKHNGYATREALDVLIARLGLTALDREVTVSTTSIQAAIKRILKEGIYNRLPFTVTVPLYFAWRYVVLLGFLDGQRGLIYHFLQAFWYRFLVGSKVVELQQKISHLKDKREILNELERLTGYKLAT